MKSSTLLFCFFTILSVSAFSQTDEKLSIKKVLNDYMIGGTEGDVERLVSAFHPQAMMKYVKNGTYTEVNAPKFFREKMTPGKKAERTNEILMVDITGNTAVAKLKLTYPNKIFTDYMTLLKTDGQWKIINKAFHLEKLNE